MENVKMSKEEFKNYIAIKESAKSLLQEMESNGRFVEVYQKMLKDKLQLMKRFESYE